MEAYGSLKTPFLAMRVLLEVRGTIDAIDSDDAVAQLHERGIETAPGDLTCLGNTARSRKASPSNDNGLPALPRWLSLLLPPLGCGVIVAIGAGVLRSTGTHVRVFDLIIFWLVASAAMVAIRAFGLEAKGPTK